MRELLFNLLCEALIRLANKKDDRVVQINVQYESGRSILYFASDKDRDEAVRIVRRINSLPPEVRARIDEVIAYADKNMERRPDHE